ncbi:MAG: Re/Si-specific NAD(P)(+) transhydrogenase subunit alpha [Pseudomonadota bacterium]|nr:Re/Si-specific NAD(P)(+) transhydrogenase subunit alpha [Pseudomonadota bacterium]
MRIGVLAEAVEGETRVAATPDTVKAYVKKGLRVVVQAGAGKGSFLSDDAYAKAGASIGADPGGLAGCDVILTVRRPSAEALAAVKEGALIIGQMDPYGEAGGIAALAKQGHSLFSMELMPRISRAQSMDVLSSQANLAGYKAVIDAAAKFSRAFPMMMTAAGTVAPARVFVMGAGVAGLQAIATARRLGAVVSATDVRAAVAEQVQSLGAKFIFIAGLKDAASAGGYALELSEEDRERQAALVAEHIANQDIVITTALIPGRPAPQLVSREMVESMKAGSVIVDLAVERGGNCVLSKPGQTVEHHGVFIMGHHNLAAGLAGNASALYARNLQNLVDLIVAGDGSLKVDWNDEIIKGIALARNGEIIHPVLAAKG